jgi:predicted RecB family nuclease
MPTPITASILYNLVACPHRVTMDAFADPTERDPPNPFVKLLWERGLLHERELMQGTGMPAVDLSAYRGEEKERRTQEALEEGVPLIYGGQIRADDLLGAPDLLRREGDGYIAGDIKSGAGEEAREERRRPKMHYAVQLALYTDILERKGISAGRRGFIWDIDFEEVSYDFRAPYGFRPPRPLWETYRETLATARAILGKTEHTLPAYSPGACNLCHWYSACLRALTEADDLTLIPALGRGKRDAMRKEVRSIWSFAVMPIDRFTVGEKTVFPGIGRAALEKFHRRAVLISDPGGRPYLREPVVLPQAPVELFFDVEVDPLRDCCYLHGFLERRRDLSERYIAFFADEPSAQAEEKAFGEAWRYLQAIGPHVLYYYSKYERTSYRRLREKYPQVCTAEELNALFEPPMAVDLYNDVVRPKTEWPTRDYSIKTLAKYLGFRWRDPHPSGAASIEWYDRWARQKAPALKERILAYNEDDCRATQVLLDAIKSFPLIRPQDGGQRGSEP